MYQNKNGNIPIFIKITNIKIIYNSIFNEIKYSDAKEMNINEDEIHWKIKYLIKLSLKYLLKKIITGIKDMVLTSNQSHIKNIVLELIPIKILKININKNGNKLILFKIYIKQKFNYNKSL